MAAASLAFAKSPPMSPMRPPLGKKKKRGPSALGGSGAVSGKGKKRDDDDLGDMTAPWPADEEARLREAVIEHGEGQWSDIAEHMAPFGRSELACKKHWQATQSVIKGAWTKEEDDLLRHVVTRSGAKRWSKIAEHIPRRNAKQCRERWVNNLDDTVNKACWTEEEDQLLIDTQKKIGNRWSEIAKILPGRPDNAVKNRWYSMMNRQANKSGTGSSKSKSGSGGSASGTRPSRSGSASSASSAGSAPASKSGAGGGGGGAFGGASRRPAGGGSEAEGDDRGMSSGMPGSARSKSGGGSSSKKSRSHSRTGHARTSKGTRSGAGAAEGEDAEMDGAESGDGSDTSSGSSGSGSSGSDGGSTSSDDASSEDGEGEGSAAIAPDGMTTPRTPAARSLRRRAPGSLRTPAASPGSAHEAPFSPIVTASGSRGGFGRSGHGLAHNGAASVASAHRTPGAGAGAGAGEGTRTRSSGLPSSSPEGGEGSGLPYPGSGSAPSTHSGGGSVGGGMSGGGKRDRVPTMFSLSPPVSRRMEAIAAAGTHRDGVGHPSPPEYRATSPAAHNLDESLGHASMGGAIGGMGGSAPLFPEMNAALGELLSPANFVRHSADYNPERLPPAAGDHGAEVDIDMQSATGHAAHAGHPGHGGNAGHAHGHGMGGVGMGMAHMGVGVGHIGMAPAAAEAEDQLSALSSDDSRASPAASEDIEPNGVDDSLELDAMDGMGMGMGGTVATSPPTLLHESPTFYNELMYALHGGGTPSASPTAPRGALGGASSGAGTGAGAGVPVHMTGAGAGVVAVSVPAMPMRSAHLHTLMSGQGQGPAQALAHGHGLAHMYHAPAHTPIGAGSQSPADGMFVA